MYFKYKRISPEKIRCKKMILIRNDADTGISKIHDDLNALIESVRECQKSVKTALYSDVFGELAELMRNMEMAEDQFSDKMEKIMQSFGIEEICPKHGESFDYHMHERENRNDRGNIVDECMNRGWKLGNEKLLSAVVRTIETNGDESNDQ